MNEDRHWSMVSGLRKPGDLLARSELCHLHDGREEAEACAIDEKLVLVVRRSLSEIIQRPGLRRRSDASSGRALTGATA